jgi:AraC-like DNA-binding protein
MIFREIALPDGLSSIAFCAWQFVVEPHDPPAFQHVIPPDGTTNLALILIAGAPPRPMLVPPSLAARTVPVAQGAYYAGLRLRPEAARMVTGREPAPGPPDLLPLDGPLAPIWSDLFALAEGGTDWRASLAAFGGCAAADAAIAGAVTRLVESGGCASIASLAAASGLGVRQFRRRFHAAIGVAPKQYADVQRARRALLLALLERDWAGAAHEAGFADQPHFARDIKDRFGAPPRRVAGYLGGIRHEMLDDVRIIQDARAAAA